MGARVLKEKEFIREGKMPGSSARAEKLRVCHWSAHPKSVASLNEAEAKHLLPQTSRAQATNTTISQGQWHKQCVFL